MRPLHEVARNTRAGHFVWPGGGEVDKSDVDWNIAFFEIPHGTDSGSRSHISTLLSLPPPLPLRSFPSLSFSPSPPCFFFSASLSFPLCPSLFDPTALSLTSFPYSLPWFLSLSRSLAFYFCLFLRCPSSLLLRPFTWPMRKTHATGTRINSRGWKVTTAIWSSVNFILSPLTITLPACLLSLSLYFSSISLEAADTFIVEYLLAAAYYSMCRILKTRVTARPWDPARILSNRKSNYSANEVDNMIKPFETPVSAYNMQM